jgi:hypothetical protein
MSIRRYCYAGDMGSKRTFQSSRQSRKNGSSGLLSTCISSPISPWCNGPNFGMAVGVA